MTYPIHVLTPENFKSEIWLVTEAPMLLYARGSAQALELLKRIPERGLAVVGTRNPQIRSLQNLNRVINQLRTSDLVIVSGFALGVDAAAHRAALLSGLPTIGVLGGGLNRIYPQEHHGFQNEILDAGGLLISETPPNDDAKADNFLRRNRLIAGWSKATWVVEAGYRSGALNTARWARDQHRITFATPCYPGDVALAGNQILLDRDHARPIWNAQSLGEVWLELSTISLKSGHKSAAVTILKGSDERLLINKVAQLSLEKSGADVHELLNWAIALNWPPARFFTALQWSLEKGHLLDQNGLLLKNTAL